MKHQLVVTGKTLGKVNQLAGKGEQRLRRIAGLSHLLVDIGKHQIKATATGMNKECLFIREIVVNVTGGHPQL